MNVGILTFHSQLNYGGVLQAFALRKVLEGLGHRPQILNWWFDAANTMLWGPFAVSSTKVKAGVALRCALGAGEPPAVLLRRLRTARFIRTHLAPTPWHFQTWREAAQHEMALDAIVVGSDQVWHCGDWGDPRPFLLDGAPTGLRAVAYAASFGMPAIPKQWEAAFRAGIPRFDAISVREQEGIRLLEPFGVRAVHVLDPTQLLSADTWRQTLKTHRRKERPTLVAYLLREDPIQAWPHLENFARRMNARVEVFTQDFALPPPTSLATLRRRLQTSARILRPGPVRLRLSADPRAFVEAFDNARWVVSDSFHALMFASIFEKDVRFLRPTTPGRLQMFARIEEFAARHIHGPSIADTLPAALDALAHGPAVSHDTASLTAARAHSLTWLRTALT